MSGANSVTIEGLVEAVQKESILLMLLQQRGGKNLEGSNPSTPSETGPSLASAQESTPSSPKSPEKSITAPQGASAGSVPMRSLPPPLPQPPQLQLLKETDATSLPAEINLSS